MKLEQSIGGHGAHSYHLSPTRRNIENITFAHKLFPAANKWLIAWNGTKKSVMTISNIVAIVVNDRTSIRLPFQNTNHEIVRIVKDVKFDK